MKLKKPLIFITVTILVVAIIAAVFLFFKKPEKKIYENPTSPSSSETTKVEVKTWKEEGAVIPGKYADADIIKVEDGYRMYYGLEPEVPGFKNQVYTAFSLDGKTWTDQKEIMTGATFPSVLKITSGYRMYFQANTPGASGIMSATSQDGISWTKESAFRVTAPKTYEDEEVESIAAPTVEIMDDSSYLMVYRMGLKKKYNSEAPNQTTTFFLYATSTDGLSWVEKGLAVDSRNETLLGMIDGAELFKEDNKYKLYFWGYAGVYYTTYENGEFGKPNLEFQKSDVPKGAKFAPNPPGDPTLVKIGEKLYMYYGQHEKGIYLATK